MRTEVPKAARCRKPQRRTPPAEVEQGEISVARAGNVRVTDEAGNTPGPTPVGTLGQWLTRHHFNRELARDVEREIRRIASQRLPRSQERALLRDVAARLDGAGGLP